MTTTSENSYQQILTLVDELTDGLDSKTLDEQIEVAAALHALTGRLTDRIKPVKTALREAIESEGIVSGTKHFDGTVNGRATVTIPDIGYAIDKNADIDLLKTVLGDAFDEYFDTKVTYGVRKSAPEAIGKIASSDRRDLVMKHVKRKESAPRVSFHRK